MEKRARHRMRVAPLLAGLLAACGGADTIPPHPATGRLTVTIAGLAGAPAAVRIDGPDQYSTTIAVSGTLEDLAPGDYLITAASVGDGAHFYDPAPITQHAAVEIRSAPTVAMVTYGLSVGADLIIDGANITQSVQSYAGSVPLVSGRDGLLRVFVRAAYINTATPKVRVRWFNSSSLIRTDTILAPAPAVPTTISEDSLGTSWNLHVPGTLIQPGLALLVDVDPGGEFVESNETNNAFPASGAAMALDVHTEERFDVALVPVRSPTNGITGDVTANNAEDYLGYLQRIYPLPGHTATVHAVYTASDSTQPVDFEAILTEIGALRLAENAPPSLDYYGVVGRAWAEGQGFSAISFLGAPGAAGIDGARSDQLLAHELGHNWGRVHSPGCGLQQGTDPNYPNTDGSLDAYGVDVSDDSIFRPANTYDIMTYCDPRWASAYTYAGVMAFREAGWPQARAAAGAPEPVLLLWGRIEGETLVLEPAFELVARRHLPVRVGPYRLEGLDGGGRPLFSHFFAGEELADAPAGRRSFAFTVPLSEFDITRLASLHLTGPAGAMTRVSGSAAATMGAGVRPPSTVSAQRLTGGMARVTWDPRYPMAMIRDARTGQVLSFARGNSVSLVVPGQQLSITLSDGVRSVTEVVAAH